MFNSVVLDLEAEGDKLTGKKGDHFSFVAIGELWSSSGYPKLGFDGTIQDDEMKLTLTWSFVGADDAAARKLEMVGKKLSN